MKMIIGGACQGKKAYASKLTGITEWLNGDNCSLEELCCGKGVTDFHLFVRRQLQEEKEVSNLAEQLIERNPEMVIVGNEIGYGVVPIDAFERNYRETYGRICTKLAAYSMEIHRVVCGIGTAIKSDEETK